MFSSESPGPSAAPAEATQDEPRHLSPWHRMVEVFVRPASAWSGLRERAQWWFPMLLFVAVTLAASLLLYERAYLPDMMSTVEEKVASGEMTAEQVQHVEDFYRQPMGRLFTIGLGALALPVITFLVALLVWFTVGFVLGAPFRYRHALEVATWSSLVTLPPTVLSYALGWVRQSMRGVHVGFGILLPEPGAGDRLLRSAGVFLDWVGPFGIWHVAVAVLGAACLSGAPRRSVAWALGTLYVVSGLFAAALAAMIPAGA